MTRIEILLDQIIEDNKRLKDTNDVFAERNRKFIQELAKLYEENEKLKKELETARENYSNADDYQKMYYQTLQEIKEIAERQMRCCTCKLDDYKSGCKECESKYAREISVEILETISEVLDVRGY